jgi:hypothetical protein
MHTSSQETLENIFVAYRKAGKHYGKRVFGYLGKF